MELIGQHKTNFVYYFLPKEEPLENLPAENWVCLGIANQEFDKPLFNRFIKHSIYSGLLEFKGQGIYGEKLHDWFDDEVVNLEVIEEYPETDVMTTWYSGEENDLANAVWSCFYAQILPEGTDATQTKVVCLPFDGADYRKELAIILDRLNNGWIPPDE
ncbi:hypothetical protein [Flavisolibacter nicotianae]|uniref:hypothetical protein n=1 Tax=Flavisolibacter nicotianae TaxID=2364882 RepID=UPI000EB346A7|nr:hypothetical protein [Flavisolibacter nicotianae]